MSTAGGAENPIWNRLDPVFSVSKGKTEPLVAYRNLARMITHPSAWPVQVRSPSISRGGRVVPPTSTHHNGFCYSLFAQVLAPVEAPGLHFSAAARIHPAHPQPRRCS